MKTKMKHSESKAKSSFLTALDPIPASFAAGVDEAPYPYDKKMKRKPYEKEKRLLQIELLKLQRWVKDEGERIVIIFEGRDAAGKGGTIKRFTEFLNPRGARVVALAKPNTTEQGQWYFQRYIERLPTRGEITFFDRSWYNRAGVEPVMGFCNDQDYLQFLRQAPEFERSIVESGIRLFKLWFSIKQETQIERFEDRRKNPLKIWKLSPVDLDSQGKWQEYTLARDRMFYFTHTPESPWTLIRSDDKKRARLAAMQFVLHLLPYAEKDPKIACPPDRLIVNPGNGYAM